MDLIQSQWYGPDPKPMEVDFVMISAGFGSDLAISGLKQAQMRDNFFKQYFPPARITCASFLFLKSVGWRRLILCSGT